MNDTSKNLKVNTSNIEKWEEKKKTFTSFFISDIIGEEIVVDKNVEEHDDSVHETLAEIEGNSFILGSGPLNKADNCIHQKRVSTTSCFNKRMNAVLVSSF